MSKYITKHSLSIGYNLDGQNFFDVVNNYRDYIHSYFFSLTDQLGCQPLDTDYVICTLMDSNTYGIPANLLFNTEYAQSRWEELIEKSIDIVNLTAVTVLSPGLAKQIKQKYPHLEIHLSVRYWDYNPDIPCMDLLTRDIDSLKENVSVINISDVRSYNDFEFANLIRDLGFKTKFITNEVCVVNRGDNYCMFPGFEGTPHCAGAPCRIACIKVNDEYPWLMLGRASFYKEFIPVWGHQYDILKLSTRYTDTTTVDYTLAYWTSDDNTKAITYNDEKLMVYKHYDEYLQWVKEKAKCNHRCWDCKKCLYYYNVFKS